MSSTNPAPKPTSARRTAPATVANRPTQRGLLDIKTVLSDPIPYAGSEFTVYMLVTNLFDVPIWPKSPAVFLPSELQPISRQYTPGNFQALLAQVAAGDFPPSHQPRRWPWSFLRRKPRYAEGIEDELKYLATQAMKLDKDLETIEQERVAVKQQIDAAGAGKSIDERRKLYLQDEQVRALMARDGTLAEQANALRQRLAALRNALVILTESTAIITDGDLTLSNLRLSRSLYLQARGSVSIASAALSTPVEALDSSSLGPGDALEPGNTAVYSLRLTTKRSIFFRPAQYNLQYSINFCFEPIATPGIPIQTNSVSQALVIRAPILSVMAGAVLGGVAGYLARFLQTFGQAPASAIATNWLTAILALVVTVILSAMAVVFLARKSETQSLVSVEDFWGGLVIGFLVGYSGTTAFENIAGLAATAPATPTP